MFGLSGDINDPKDPKKLDKEKVAKLLEKLGVASKTIEATYVEIRTRDKIIRVKDPSVIMTLLFGRDVYQVTGDVEEVPLKVSDAQMKKIMKDTGKTKSEVSKTLAKLNYDTAKAVAELKQVSRKTRKK